MATMATLEALLERLEKTTAEGFAHMNRKFSQVVLKELYQSERAQQDERIRQLEDSFRWITRLVLGLVVAGIVGVVLGTQGLHP